MRTTITFDDHLLEQLKRRTVLEAGRRLEMNRSVSSPAGMTGLQRRQPMVNGGQSRRSLAIENAETP